MGLGGSKDSSAESYVTSCIERGIAARENGDNSVALRWFEEVLAARAGNVATQSSSYSEPLVSALILVGDAYFWDNRTERALYYYLRANAELDPRMDLPAMYKSAALNHFISVTAGLVLVYHRLAETATVDPVNRAVGEETFDGLQPMEQAELQLNRCIAVVVMAEGTQTATLIPLLHMLARVLIARRKTLAALRIMQRCMGITLRVAQTLHIYSFLSYTRIVLDAVKQCVRRDEASRKILAWWKKRRAAAPLLQPSNSNPTQKAFGLASGDEHEPLPSPEATLSQHELVHWSRAAAAADATSSMVPPNIKPKQFLEAPDFQPAVGPPPYASQRDP